MIQLTFLLVISVIGFVSASDLPGPFNELCYIIASLALICFCLSVWLLCGQTKHKEDSKKEGKPK